MERSPICPNCLSKWPDVHGLLYAVGSCVGERCDDVWHKGAEYDPNRWALSAEDEKFLAENYISIR